MASPIISMSFSDMVEAAMEEERRKRQAENDALSETVPLVDALLEEVSKQAVKLPKAEILTDIVGPQATVSQAINNDHNKQQEGQLTQTSDQASNAPPNINVNIAGTETKSSLEENLELLPPLSGTSSQNEYAAQNRAPSVSGQTSNTTNKEELGPRPAQIEDHHAAKKVKLTKQEDDTRSDPAINEPAISEPSISEPAIPSSAVPPAVGPVAPKAEDPLVTPESVYLIPELVYHQDVAPISIHPEVGICNTASPNTTSPKDAVPKVTNSITTAPTDTTIETDRLITAALYINSLQGLKQPQARTPGIVASPEAELSQAVDLNHSAQQEVQAAATVGQVHNAQKPAALTARAISGLVAKKRKRPAAPALSRSLFVGPTPQPESSKGYTRPKSEPSPPTTDTTASSPARSQGGEGDDNGPSRASSATGHTPRKPRQKSKAKTVYLSREIVDARGKSTEWYDKIDMTAKFARGDKAMLEYVKQLIKNCVDAAKNGGDKEKWFLELRNYVHDMASYQFLKPVLVRKSGVLEEDGLLLIFSGPDKDLFPWDIASDAAELWGRWITGDIDGFILRGIVITKTVTDKGKKRTSYSIQNPYPLKRSANVPGSNHLMNGQWWPMRICALRDGAHGAIEAGISGQADSGAYSIVLGASKSNDYQDKDDGYTLQYCGTKSSTPAPTADTLLLDKTFLTRGPIRVLRAANPESKYAPKEGVRYDGLYDIVDCEVLDPAIAWKRFSLRRRDGQDPIRYQGVEARPSSRELRDRMSVRKEL